ncbi:ATP-binding protein [Paenibacillus tyrfis]|uniref:ATP-binding protein n=1 Tax=Paenibacillus tyrfis TaxID=1501230 RepID=A0A081NUL2_9BACL|nr:ATP-binding protein [Paenibacillus tyrfis]KEQ22135.1 hypothetical protein ET33_27640 [Paenibacillus tyrfis]
MNIAKFKVQPRVVYLLSNQYRSSEQALKELVDNAWDADAEQVHITIPLDLFPTEAIIIQDDGTGMSTSQVMSDYLNIAYNRRVQKGELTPYKTRKVRGHKGIGKFAGLVAASQMEVQTTHNSITSTLIINKDDLYNYDNDLEELNIEVISRVSDNPRGTKIILSGLNQGLNLPSVEKLRELLIFEFGRQSDFDIYINGEKVTFEDIQGTKKAFTKKLDEAGDIAVSLVISDHKKPLKNPGLIIRVGGRVIGDPTFFGLENESLVPKKFLSRIYGEIEADGLIEAVNSGWDYIYENSKGYIELTSFMKRFLINELKSKFKDETIELENEILHEFKQEIEKFPLPRQEAIRKSINRILNKFYGDSEDKIKTIVSLLIKALEEDEYWDIMKRIEEASAKDVDSLAAALNVFGIMELSNVARQAQKRIEFLRHLNQLISNPQTLEKEMHIALENNLWIFGIEYSMKSSNETLKNVISNYCQQKFKGSREKRRPDLLLANDILNKHLIIEFKRPSKEITRDDENQAEKYRDDLIPFIGSDIEIMVIGGRVDPGISRIHTQSTIQLRSYFEVISKAESQLRWLLDNLNN